MQRIEQQPREEEEPRPVNHTTWTAREKKLQMVLLLRRFVSMCDCGLRVNLLSVVNDRNNKYIFNTDV